MGWTFHYQAPRNRAEEKAEIEKLCTWEDEQAKRFPVQVSQVGNVWYVAIRVMPKVDYAPLTDSTYIADSDGSYTFCAVFLTSRRDGERVYKDMTECMGPVESKAPMSLIRKLSKIHDGESYAIQWRESCRKYAASKPPALKEGDVIKTRPIALPNGDTIKNFRVDTYRQRGKNRKVYFCLDNLGMYSLQRRHLTGLEILARA